MRNVYYLYAILSLFILSSCATQEQIQARQELLNQFNKTKPLCNSDDECARKWSAAQIWVLRNCGMKIQIATDSIIETYNAPSGSTSLQCRVTKEPVPDGGYVINLNIGCPNFITCNYDPLESGLRFNMSVNSAGK